MAENKKGFILYANLIDSVELLSDDDAGQLFKHILQFVNDENPISENLLVKLSFVPIQQSLERDYEKWKGTRMKRSDAGKKSAESKRKKKEEKLKIDDVSTKSTSVESVESELTKSTVKDKVIVKVIDNVIVNDKEKEVLLSSITFSDEVLISSQFNRITFNFWNLFKKNMMDSGIKQTKTLDKAKLYEWSKHIQLMIEKDGRTIDEIKIVKEFLKSNDFWKKNIQSTKKLRIQFEKLFINAKQNNQNGKSTALDATERNKLDSKERTTRIVEKLQNNQHNHQQE